MVAARITIFVFGLVATPLVWSTPGLAGIAVYMDNAERVNEAVAHECSMMQPHLRSQFESTLAAWKLRNAEVLVRIEEQMEAIRRPQSNTPEANRALELEERKKLDDYLSELTADLRAGDLERCEEILLEMAEDNLEDWLEGPNR